MGITAVIPCSDLRKIHRCVLCDGFTNRKNYFLFTISQNFAYRYDYTMDKFVDKVTKKYKVKT